MKHRAVNIFAILLALFGAFYSINSEIISENGYNFFYPIIYAFESKATQTTMQQLIGPPPAKEKQRKYIYLLVLDRSFALDWKGDHPSWYTQTIDTLNRRTELNFDRYLRSRSGSDLCKINLFQVLFDIENQPAHFVVLKLGDSTTKLYPLENKIMSCEANTGNILDAICQVEKNTRNDGELNTDFNSLITKVLENYINRLPKTSHPDGLPLVKLIIISDLIHDVKVKLEKELRDNRRYTINQLSYSIKEDKVQLIAQIKELLKSPLLVNIVITRGAQHRKLLSHEVYTWEYLNKTRKFPPQKIPIHRYTWLSLLYSVKARGTIDFYHKGNAFIPTETSFTILNDRQGDYKFSLDLPEKNSDPPKSTMKYQILDTGGTPIGEKSGYFDFKGAISEIQEVKPNHYIQFIYSMEVPPRDIISTLNVYPPGEKRRFFSVPVHFKKRFNTFNVIIILLIYLYIISCFVYYLFHFKNLSFLLQVSQGIFFKIKNFFS